MSAQKTFHTYFNTPIGWLKITTTANALVNIDFVKTKGKISTEKKPEILKDCETQLKAYFAGKRSTFDLPLDPQGTPFQKNVWRTLCQVPCGQTASYKDIAVKINNPKGFRAIGMANNKNPIPIIIPCHRIIGTNGDLVGYAGGLKIKSWLINNEKSFLKSAR